MTEPTLRVLGEDECLALLRSNGVGRVGIVEDDYPSILPVNYRLVELAGRKLVALRTRPGGVVDLAPRHVAFEVDGVDALHGTGWSVLVRGLLHHLGAEEMPVRAVFDSVPWLSGRDTWLVIEAERITGRRIEAPTIEWAFHASAYL